MPVHCCALLAAGQEEMCIRDSGGDAVRKPAHQPGLFLDDLQERGRNQFHFLSYGCTDEGGDAPPGRDGRENIHDCGKGGIFGAELFQLCIQEAGRSIDVYKRQVEANSVYTPLQS